MNTHPRSTSYTTTVLQSICFSTNCKRMMHNCSVCYLLPFLPSKIKQAFHLHYCKFPWGDSITLWWSPWNLLQNYKMLGSGQKNPSRYMAYFSSYALYLQSHYNTMYQSLFLMLRSQVTYDNPQRTFLTASLTDAQDMLLTLYFLCGWDCIIKTDSALRIF